MKKVLVTAICAAAFGVAAQAAGTDVLMWYLDLSDSPDQGTADTTTFDSMNFYMVRSDDMSRTPVVNLNAKTYQSAGDLQSGANAGIPSSSIQDGFRAGNFYTDLRGIDMTGYEFMMTLYSGGDLVAWTKWLYNDNLEADQHVTLASIQQASGLYSLGEIAGNDLAGGGASLTPYGFGKDVVPEPTGGLLMLVGASLLALRRRRA